MLFVWRRGSCCFLKEEEPDRLGATQCELVSVCLVKYVCVPLEHTAHHQNPTNWSSNFQSAASLHPSTSRWSHFMHIPDRAAIRTMQLHPVGQFVPTQNNTLHNETKLDCFTRVHTLVVCSHLLKFGQLFIFKGENNLPKLVRRSVLHKSPSMHKAP